MHQDESQSAFAVKPKGPSWWSKLPTDKFGSAMVCANCVHAKKAYVLVGRLYHLLYDYVPELSRAVELRPRVDSWVQSPPVPPLSNALVEALKALADIEKWTVRCAHEKIRVNFLSESCYAWEPRVSS